MIDPGLGNVVLGATQGSDTLVAFASGETLIGGIGNLAMFGDANNALYGGEGSDTIVGAAGANTIVTGTGQNLRYLGAGNNLVVSRGSAGSSTGNNIFVGSYLGPDQIYGGAGDDTIVARGAYNSTLFGGGGANLFILNDNLEYVVIGDFRPGLDHVTGLSATMVATLSASATTSGGNTTVSGAVPGGPFPFGVSITFLGISQVDRPRSKLRHDRAYRPDRRHREGRPRQAISRGRPFASRRSSRTRTALARL